ncbi:rhodanese-like domain-containing protein [Brachybacterium vulturis]|uniref:rhodanese-like domain-containing protein n=1 Tax=Brachybacterium vulturis TaxID=2017484 RepID=UPI0037358BBE
MTATVQNDARSIAPTELTQRLAEDPELMIIDVRTPGEFATTHIRGSYNVPLELLTEHTADLAERMGEHVVLVCQSGSRAGTACTALQRAGVDSAAVLAGGIAAFEQSGGAVVRRGTRWAMDRQVRMTAGSLVLVGTLAGQLLHPRLGLFAGAIGAGLTYSALSDSCAMASLLSKMPWNRVAPDPSLAALFEQTPAPTP